MKSRTCVICKAEFTPNSPSQLTCGKECSRKRTLKKQRERMKNYYSKTSKKSKKPTLKISDMIRLLNLYNKYNEPISYGRLVRMLEREEISREEIERMGANATGNRPVHGFTCGEHVACK
jgi:hypothetical protein